MAVVALKQRKIAEKQTQEAKLLQTELVQTLASINVSDARIESLRTFELAFIDEFAVPDKPFNAAAFEAKVGEGNAKFHQTIADEKFTARRPVLSDLKGAIRRRRRVSAIQSQPWQSHPRAGNRDEEKYQLGLRSCPRPISPTLESPRAGSLTSTQLRRRDCID